MPKRVAISNLNARTIDILNVIRQNASLEYQNTVPKIEKETDIPAVGEIIYGNPSISNQFINALVNRIAMVRVKSSTFNNIYARLKKGYLGFGETIEEVFVDLCRAREFSAEKAEEREFKRTIPDVKSAFHTMNWRVQYPITIQDEDLRQAFTSADGVTDLIAKIVESVYTSAEYDEFLLFKYLMIKGITKGAMHPISVDGTNIKNYAVNFRGTSNRLTLMSTKFNQSRVHTTTPRASQVIFMDSDFNAQFDVNVLASAFNMDKADFMGSLFLIDDWADFDNDRFETIRKNSDMVEEVTQDELNIMKNVKAVLVDEEFFQVYDNNNKMTEQYVASGMYWNYFYNVWKTVSYSPFSNAIVFVDNSQNITLPESLTVKVTQKIDSEEATILVMNVQNAGYTIAGGGFKFVQDETTTQNAIAVHEYGAYIIPTSAVSQTFNPTVEINGTTYKADTTASGDTAEQGATFTLNKEG